MDNAAIIETRGLVKTYGDGVEVHALDGVSMLVTPGEIVSVMGPSGSGKSTLLNMIGALDIPTSGQVCVNGHDLAAVRNLDTFRARTVGFIFQMHNLIPTLSARENVQVPMMGQPVGRKQRHNRATELLELVGLADRTDHLPNQLSGGERQRVAVARSMANQPAIVLADEPTGNLDSHSGAEIIALMHRLNQELGTTLILVTHDPVVARQADRILIMGDGCIVHEHTVGTSFEEDLAAFERSGLGRALLARDEASLAKLAPDVQAGLRRMLAGMA